MCRLQGLGLGVRGLGVLAVARLYDRWAFGNAACHVWEGISLAPLQRAQQ